MFNVRQISLLAHLVHFTQHENIRYALRQLGKTIFQCLPEFFFVHDFMGFRSPFVRSKVVIPKALFHKFMGAVVSEKLQIRKRGLPAELAIVINNFIFRMPTSQLRCDERPANLSCDRTATSNVS
jgi:hypothetical protein